jgi:hypothetical protein
MTLHTVALALSAALAAAAAGPALAQQSYRCVDPSGKVVYTERACEAMGLRTEKSIKDLPATAAQGSTTTRPPAAAATAAARPAPARAETRSVMCGDKPVKCERGTTLTCGGQAVRCEGD